MDKGSAETKISKQLEDIEIAIKSIKNSDDMSKFLLYSGINEVNSYSKKHPNGVKPIKDAFVKYLESQGWVSELRYGLGVTQKRPGPIDSVFVNGASSVAVEWETGNISSSHRAINKLVIGLLEKNIIAGILILPSRAMYNHLTDRIGNFQELEPYFPVWKEANYNIAEGFLCVYEIEHDELTDDASYKIKKGTDGWNLLNSH
ncbi:hypothetical protein Q3D33_05780 [Enterococcus faecium]|nr:hypothetical protein [Enterococcus faecium]